MARFILALGFVVTLGGAALADPPTAERPHETLTERPSGFWTSNRPVAVGAEYKWRLLGLGCAIALLTGWLTYRLVKNARGPEERQAERIRHRDALLAAAKLPEHQVTTVIVVSSSERRTTP